MRGHPNRAMQPTFARRLHERRVSVGMGPTALARAVGTSEAAIRRYETLSYMPDDARIAALATALRTTPAYLLGAVELP